MHLSNQFNGASIRLLMGSLLPALSAIVASIALSGPPESIGIKFLQGLMQMLGLAYLTVGLQSLIYSLLMEFVVLRYIRSPWGVLAVSAVLGMAAGYSMSSFVGVRAGGDFVWLGLATGVFVGGLLWAARASEDARDRSAGDGGWRRYLLAAGMLSLFALTIAVVLTEGPFARRDLWWVGIPGLVAALIALCAVGMGLAGLRKQDAGVRTRALKVMLIGTGAAIAVLSGLD